jgi:NSS family neurotransmitter:Na+ symporter
MTKKSREMLSSRLGFILVSAGCAIGLGNVWRFPFITGRYGGAIFLLLYLLFIVLLSSPVLVMEFAIGRAARTGWGHAFQKLSPSGSRWRFLGPLAPVGLTTLMMFYIPVTGWILAYAWAAAAGGFHASGFEAPAFFGSLLSSPARMGGWTFLAAALGFAVCAMGLRDGVERCTKVLMAGLLLLMVALAGYAMMLPGAAEGLKFYLSPSLANARAAGWATLLRESMNQAFFTLSVGIGSMTVFGSYLSRERSLPQESAWIVTLDTFVALLAGLIIFPVCYSFGQAPDAGPSLVFVTMPRLFAQMPGGRFFATLFFLFMSIAALSTVIAVLEGILSWAMDAFRWSRKKAVCVAGPAVTLLTAPCVLGFNLWSGFHPLGKDSCILDLEDFVVSNTLLPLGALLLALFVVSPRGWGWKAFVAEANAGEGMQMPRWARVWCCVVPLLIAVVLVVGYWEKFAR